MRKACLTCPNRSSCPLLGKSSTNDIILDTKVRQIEVSNEKMTPGEVIARSVKILRELKGLPEPKVSPFADLYVYKAERQKHRLAYAARQIENIERGLTAGGISGVGSLYGTPNPHCMVQPGDNRITEDARREIAEADRIKRRCRYEAEIRSMENRWL